MPVERQIYQLKNNQIATSITNFLGSAIATLQDNINRMIELSESESDATNYTYLFINTLNCDILRGFAAANFISVVYGTSTTTTSINFLAYSTQYSNNMLVDAYPYKSIYDKQYIIDEISFLDDGNSVSSGYNYFMTYDETNILKPATALTTAGSYMTTDVIVNLTQVKKDFEKIYAHYTALKSASV